MGRLRPSARPLRVHVCVDQPLDDAPTSGLVGTWRRLWVEAAAHPDLDVTGHAPGRAARIERIAPNVRIVEHAPAAVSSALLARVGVPVPARVGFVPLHLGLARAVAAADVIHSTYTLFSFAMTALWVSAARGVPLVSSLQTQVPQQAEIYAAAIAERIARASPGALRGAVGRLPGAVRRALDAQARWYFGRCARVLLSSSADLDALPPGYPRARVAFLGRGVDPAVFTPAARDRAFLRSRFGIPDGVPVLLYVGKLMPEKNVTLLARALGALRRDGRPFALLAFGQGAQGADLAAELGDRVRLGGVQPHELLRVAYASADLLVFPSATETYGQVVMEAASAGLPALVSARGGASQHLDGGGEVGLAVARDTPSEWARAVAALLADPARLRRMGRAARRRAELVYGGWADVFARAVKPAWLAAAGRGEATAAR